MAPTDPNQTIQTNLDSFLSRNDTDTSWQVAGGKKKRKVTESPESPPNDAAIACTKGNVNNSCQTNPVLITNRFQALSNKASSASTNDDVISTDVNGQPTNEANANAKKARPPPIYIHNVVEMSGLIKTVKKIIGTDKYRTTVLSNNVVRVNAIETDDYRLLVRELRAIKVEFHTYQLKTERALKVVIHQVHPSIQPNEIKEALEAIGYNCRNVTNVRHWQTKEPLPLFFVNLESDEKSKEIYQLRSLLHMQIKVESPRPQKTIVQCHRCQQYGHTRAYCTLPEVCVKCGEGHPWDKCPRPRDEKPKCGLCKGAHTTMAKLPSALSRSPPSPPTWMPSSCGPPGSTCGGASGSGSGNVFERKIGAEQNGFAVSPLSLYKIEPREAESQPVADAEPSNEHPPGWTPSSCGFAGATCGGSGGSGSGTLLERQLDAEKEKSSSLPSSLAHKRDAEPRPAADGRPLAQHSPSWAPASCTTPGITCGVSKGARKGSDSGGTADADAGSGPPASYND
jgi:hypothetical protein